MFISYHDYHRSYRKWLVDCLVLTIQWITASAAVAFLVGYMIWQFTDGPSAGKFPQLFTDDDRLVEVYRPASRM